MFVLQILMLIVVFKILKKGGFPFEWDMALIFSLAAIGTFFHGVLSWYMGSHGKRALVAAFATGIVAGIVNILLCWFLIKRWHIFGAGFAMTVSSIVGIVGCYMAAPQQTRDIARA